MLHKKRLNIEMTSLGFSLLLFHFQIYNNTVAYVKQPSGKIRVEFLGYDLFKLFSLISIPSATQSIFIRVQLISKRTCIYSFHKCVNVKTVSASYVCYAMTTIFMYEDEELWMLITLHLLFQTHRTRKNAECSQGREEGQVNSQTPLTGGAEPRTKVY